MKIKSLQIDVIIDKHVYSKLVR